MGIIQVRRANVILDVPDYQQAEYLAKGFDVIGADGKVVMKATPNDPNSLKKAYSELQAEVEKLRAENSKLKEELASKTSEPVKAEEVVESEPEEIPEEEEPQDFTPINKRKSNKRK